MQPHFWPFSFDSMENNDSAQIHSEELVGRALSEFQKGTTMDPPSSWLSCFQAMSTRSR